MSTAVLEIRDLQVTLGGRFRVEIPALDLRGGEICVLDTASGSGKSTALGLIAGAIHPDRPALRHRIAGREVDPTAARAGFAGPAAVGFVMQTNPLVPYLTLVENIRLPLDVAGERPDTAWLDHLQRALGIVDAGPRKPRAVSVGQRQRAAIARALSGRPALLLLDEPVSALDPGNTEQVESLISHLAADAGSAIVLASHQAQRGAFHAAPRAAHAVASRGGLTVSTFAAPRARVAA